MHLFFYSQVVVQNKKELVGAQGEKSGIPEKTCMVWIDSLEEHHHG